MPRPLIYGPASPPLDRVKFSREPYVSHFSPARSIDNAGAKNYIFDTYAVPIQSLVGAGTGIGNSPIGPGAPPMLAIPTRRVMGVANIGGQLLSAPISQNSFDTGV